MEIPQGEGSGVHSPVCVRGWVGVVERVAVSDWAALAWSAVGCGALPLTIAVPAVPPALLLGPAALPCCPASRPDLLLAWLTPGMQPVVGPCHFLSPAGFIWDKDGHIVTNFHVIRGASDVLVSAPGWPQAAHTCPPADRSSQLPGASPGLGCRRAGQGARAARDGGAHWASHCCPSRPAPTASHPSQAADGRPVPLDASR